MKKIKQSFSYFEFIYRNKKSLLKLEIEVENASTLWELLEKKKTEFQVTCTCIIEFKKPIVIETSKGQMYTFTSWDVSE